MPCGRNLPRQLGERQIQKGHRLAKTENSFRIVPIPRQLVPYLKQSGGKNAEKYFVEGRSGEGAQMRSYQKTFKRLLEKLKIPHRGFHSLRHTFATRAIECGMDVKTLSEILGHKNVGVTLSRYAHSLTKHKTEMMDRVGRLLDRHEKSTRISLIRVLFRLVL